MNVYQEYSQKLCSAREAVKLVKSGDWVDYGSNNSKPVLLDAALAERRDELKSVKIRGNLTPGPIQVIECDPEQEHFIYNTWHCGAYERKLVSQGRAFFSPMLFRNLQWYYDNFLEVDVAMLAVSKMDEDGYFSFSCGLGAVSFIARKAKKLILEVNESLPYIYGEDARIHVSEADVIVEAGEQELMEMLPTPPTDNDRQIAGHIFPHIPDGCTLQLGIGGIPNVIGSLICDSDIKKVKMHTELCSDGYYDLYRAGKLDGGVLGLAIGSKDFYRWLDKNASLEGRNLSWVNNPAVMAKIDNLISVNGCISVDLFGQVNAETAGFRQISGTGGQLDFVTGACNSQGGKSFLCLNSTFTDGKGVVHSNIKPSLGGEVVTTPRSQAHYIVTEYGCVNLAGMSTWQRAAALVSIAHPDFRDELIHEAEKLKIWLPENKR